MSLQAALPATGFGATNGNVQSYLSSGSNASAHAITVQLGSASSLQDESGMVSEASYGLAGRLEQGFVLGTPASQPLADGSSTNQPAFDYWIESLTL